MKNTQKILSVLAAAALVLTSVSASANSITLGSVSTAPTLGGTLWTYEITLANSTLVANDSYFTINDFGPAVQVIDPLLPLPLWTFSQAVSGPNSILGAGDDGSVLNLTFTWAGLTGSVLDSVSTFTVFSPQTSLGFQVHDYTSVDRATSDGLPSRVIGSVKTPVTTPDGGTTVMLLGAALSGLALMRRKFAA